VIIQVAVRLKEQHASPLCIQVIEFHRHTQFYHTTLKL